MIVHWIDLIPSAGFILYSTAALLSMFIYTMLSLCSTCEIPTVWPYMMLLITLPTKTCCEVKVTRTQHVVSCLSHTNLHESANTHTQAHTHTHTHIRTYTYIHTHTRAAFSYASMHCKKALPLSTSYSPCVKQSAQTKINPSPYTSQVCKVMDAAHSVDGQWSVLEERERERESQICSSALI